MFKTIFHLIRVKQWIKNIFIFLPAFFGGNLLSASIPNLLFGFVCFSFIASSIYIINDLNDIESDQKHPKKKYRPIPSGKISIKIAYIVCALLFSISILLSILFLPTNFLYVILLYFGLNLAYSTILKTVSIIDILIVSLGFVLRVISGSELTGITLSFWLLLMTFLFSLFIVVAKRRDDFTTTNSTPYLLRKVNKYYSLPYLNIVLSMVASLMVVCYIMYTTASIYFENKPYHALLSCILVILGVLRYFQAIFVEEKGGSPTEFALNDRFIQLTVLLWIFTFGYLIYYP